MSLKRKRGPGHSVLDAAMKGGDPKRAKVIHEIEQNTPRVKRIANMHMHLGAQRSSSERFIKARQQMVAGGPTQRQHGVDNHVHNLLSRFNRKPRNHFKSHMDTYFAQ